MKLNTLYATTIAFDYACMASIVLFAYVCFGCGHDNTNAATDQKVAPVWMLGLLCGLYPCFLNPFREFVFSRLFPLHFAKVKTSASVQELLAKFASEVVWTSAMISAIPALAVYFGIMQGGFVSGDDNSNWISKTLVAVSLDYWLINLIKDNTSMRFLHPWMHEKENYWIHKHHHTGNKNTTLVHAFAFTLVDLVIEFGIGPVLALGVKYVLYHNHNAGDGLFPTLHVLAYMFSIWTDGNIHSMNPYTQAIGNPVLDFLLKPNIVHNLHHSCETDPRYMTVFPFHHFRPSDRQADVAKYNKLMNTNVDFRLFIE